MLYIIYLCVYIHIHLFIYLGFFHLLLYSMHVISYGMIYVYFIVYDHVHAFVGDKHSFQVRANVVLFTLSDFK